MLKKRIITTMLWNGTTLVKGQNFDNSRRAGSPMTTIQIYNSRFQESLQWLKNLGEGLQTRDQYRYDRVRRDVA